MKKIIFLLLVIMLVVFSCPYNGGSGSGSSKSKDSGDMIYRVIGSYSPIALVDINSPIVYAAYDLDENGYSSANVETDTEEKITKLKLNRKSGGTVEYQYEYYNGTKRIKTRYRFDGGILDTDETRTYEYYENGLLKERWINGVKRYEYTYYGDTSNIEKLDFYEGTPATISRNIYTYNGDNTIKTLTHYKESIGNYETFNYEYDGLNVTIKYQHLTNPNSPYTPEDESKWISYRTYSSEEPDFLLSEIKYNCDSSYNPIGSPTFTIFFAFEKKEGPTTNNDWFDRLLTNEENPENNY